MSLTMVKSKRNKKRQKKINKKKIKIRKMIRNKIKTIHSSVKCSLNDHNDVLI